MEDWSDLTPEKFSGDLDGELARLAKLTPPEYEAERKAAARAAGVRLSYLDA